MFRIFVLALTLTIVLSQTCGGNCPSDKCPICWCGTEQKMQNITQLCSQYNWNVPCCTCIMTRLSKGNANFMDYDTSSYAWSVGLWQIGPNYRNFCSVTQNPPCSVESNMKCAWQLYNDNWRGKWNGWSQAAKACGCYTNGQNEQGQLLIQ